MKIEKRTWYKFYEKISIKSNALMILGKVRCRNTLSGLLIWQPWVNKKNIALVEPEEGQRDDFL